MNPHGPGIPSTQRRLRHLKCIVIRNLVHDPSIQSLGAFYYTLHAPDDNSEFTPLSPRTPTPALSLDSAPDGSPAPGPAQAQKTGLLALNGSRPSSGPNSPNPSPNNTPRDGPARLAVRRERATSGAPSRDRATSGAPSPTTLGSSKEAIPVANGDETQQRPQTTETENADSTTTPDKTITDENNQETNSKETSEKEEEKKEKEDGRKEDGKKEESGGANAGEVPQANGSMTDLYRGDAPIDMDDDLLPPPFYTSEVVTNTSNPTWRHLDCSRFHLLDFVDTIHSFNICVWSCQQSANDTAMTPVLQYEVELADLEFIGAELRQIGYYIFPQNSLIFELRDGLYVMKETRDNMRPSRVADVKPPMAPDKRKATTCNHLAFLSLIARRKQLQKTQETGRQLSTAIEQKLNEHSAYFDLVKQRDALRLRINQLKEECASAKATLKTDEEALKSARTEMLPRARSLARAQIALLASKQQLSNQETKALEKSKETLKSITDSYEYRRWYLISQIRTIYTIQQSTDGKSLSINGFRLPNSDFTGCDEEQIATALGYVSHILVLASKYLEVPLRYPMIPMCSRSMILDEISQQTSPKFPLYSRGVDRTRFEYAVFLLNKNLEQLLNSQGLEIISLRHTLPNVQILLSRGQNL